MAETVVTRIEAPSGKDIAYENFPVGSWLLPARLRPHVAVFYAYARAIDDIADDPQLPPEEKIARLTGFEAALLGREQGEGILVHAVLNMETMLFRKGRLSPNQKQFTLLANDTKEQSHDPPSC